MVRLGESEKYNKLSRKNGKSNDKNKTDDFRTKVLMGIKFHSFWYDFFQSFSNYTIAFKADVLIYTARGS